MRVLVVRQPGAANSADSCKHGLMRVVTSQSTSQTPWEAACAWCHPPLVWVDPSSRVCVAANALARHPTKLPLSCWSDSGLGSSGASIPQVGSKVLDSPSRGLDENSRRKRKAPKFSIYRRDQKVGVGVSIPGWIRTPYSEDIC